MNNDQDFKIQVLASLADISAENWNALLPCGDNDFPNPFITHEFLFALETSNSACVETGWLAQHLILIDTQDKPLAALPCYLKNHSQGEYVFDQGWADAFERAGGRYYPKLQCSVPFTPASGPRFLIGNHKNSAQYQAVLASGLKQLCNKHEVSSAHITFMHNEQWNALETHDYLLRTDQQFHWENQGFANFTQFLDTLSSRKRKNIRKERKSAADNAQITFEWLSGSDITETILDAFYEFYLDTSNRKWGQPYLTREFYSLIAESMADKIVFIMAKRDNIYIAGAINFIGENTLFGRHWGCSQYHPALHFEICYYQAIDFAIEHKLQRVEAGAQGEHKLSRGYMPVTTHSAHWIENPGLRNAIARYLINEREHVKMEQEILTSHGPFRNSDNK